MSLFDPFVAFDPTPYQTAPHLPLQTLVILAKALSNRVPGSAPPYVKEADLEMRTTAKDAAAAMVVRLRETNEVSLALDLALDNGMDGLFVLLRDRLRGWQRYQRPGLDFLLQDPEWQVKFELVREKASKAVELLGRLFGDGNLAMLTRPFPEQAQLMTNVLNLIDEDLLEDDLLDLGGEELLPIIRRVNVEYANMVDRRASEEAASKANLRLLRSKLQRRITTYASLVLTMLKEDQPETREIVEAALLPMITMRPVRSSGASADDGELEVPDPDADLAEVLAAAEAELEQQPPQG